MRLLPFILGVLGILLIIGAFSSFIPLIFLGGIATGSVVFAFGLPIFLMILGAAMVYFGFYYKESPHTNNPQLIEIAKWGAIYTIAVLLANYILSKIVIVDSFLVILFTAAIVSIVAQVIRSHQSNFKLKWFILYFLIYATIIWIMNKFILPEISSQTVFFSSLVVGFAIAGIVSIIQKLNIHHNAVYWISITLLIILLVSNLESLQIQPQQPNSSELSGEKRICPTATSEDLNRSFSEGAFTPTSIMLALNKAIDTSIWKIEGNIRTCYKGRFTGQHPDWFYCDDMIVSRWETSSSGTIRYRWYTAVTAEWSPEKGNYIFNGLSCEGGKKVTVDKMKPSIYTYDSKDGTVIKVHISRDGTETNIEY